MGRVSSTAASTLGSGVSSPDIQEITVTANTEVTINLPTGTRRFFVKHRKSAKFTVRYDLGDTAVFTNKGGNIYTRDNLAPTSTYTLYITPLKGGILEVESWA